MEEYWSLLLLCFAMLCGCYIAGIIPLACTLSEDRLKLVTIFGAGLLIGTSLAVIIPEAVHAMYSLKTETVVEDKTPQSHTKHNDRHDKDPKQHTHDEHRHTHTDTHTSIGISLVVGFLFMLIIDQLSGGSHTHSQQGAEESQLTVIQRRNKLTATFGLVVHAAADGVALGAAVKTAETGLTIIVFFAIMLHKAPAAFGLVSFLLHENFDRSRIRRHLTMFSFAAPVMACVTYVCLNQQSKESLSQYNTTGIAMLFSAGTFLYVATVHILPEVTAPSLTHQSDGTIIQREHAGLTKIHLCTIVAGALIPVFLSLGHSH